MKSISREDLAKVLDAVKFHVVPGMVVANFKNGQSVEGQLMLTEGLAETFGYELVAYGHPTAEGLLASATLNANYFRRGVPVDVTGRITQILDTYLPELSGSAKYSQFVIDESALDGETEDVSGEPVWVADGGQSLVDEEALVETLGKVMKERESSMFERIDLVRKQYREKIETYGFTMAGVFDPSGDDVFIYTMGLTLKELPEVIVAAQLDADMLQDFVAHVAKKFMEDGVSLFEIKEVFTLVDDTTYNFRLVYVDPFVAAEQYLVQAGPVMGRAVEQVVWIQISDVDGRYPGDENFDNKFNQPTIATVISK